MSPKEKHASKHLSRDEETAFSGENSDISRTAFLDLVENMRDGYALLEEIRDEHSKTIDYVILELNAFGAKTIGVSRERLMGVRLTEILKKDARYAGRADDFVFSIASACPQKEYEEKYGDPQKWFSWKIYRASKDTVALLFRDITDRRVSQDDLAKIQRMESLGVLAGGIAHECNNLLQGIIGHISVAKYIIQGPDIAKDSLDKALSIADRTKSLSNQLLTFSKGGAPRKRLCRMDKLLPEIVKFSLLGTKIQATFHIADHTWPCEVDESQIRQVLGNIVMNAAEAKPANGKVHVTAENVSVEPQNPMKLSPGPYLRVEVSDAGTGIPSDIQSRIFDPFFTTKPSSRGLGLTSAFSIVSRHNGFIFVKSEYLIGTTVDIYLPALEEAIDPTLNPIRLSSLPPSGTILIMDDEEFIRETLSQMLLVKGFQSICVPNGEEAIQTYRQSMKNGNKFDAVILDLTIRTGIGGIEAIRYIRKLDPHVRAIVSSGYSDDPVLAQPEKYGFDAVLQKPYGFKELTHVLAATFSVCP